MKNLPETGSKELRWDRVIRLPEPTGQQAEAWRQALDAARQRVQEATLLGLRGNKNADFVAFSGEDGVLQRHIGPLQVPMMNIVQRDKRVPRFFTLRSWAFFGTHVPTLRAEPGQTYAPTAEFHSDNSDYQDALNGEQDSHPAVLWSPKTPGNMGTRVVVPAAWEDRAEPTIPALAARNVFAPNSSTATAIRSGLAEGRFRVLNLDQGPLWFLAAPVIHSRSPLPPEVQVGEGWRYNLRLGLAFDFFGAFDSEALWES